MKKVLMLSVILLIGCASKAKESVMSVTGTAVECPKKIHECQK